MGVQTNEGVLLISIKPNPIGLIEIGTRSSAELRQELADRKEDRLYRFYV